MRVVRTTLHDGYMPVLSAAAKSAYISSRDALPPKIFAIIRAFLRVSVIAMTAIRA